MEKMHSQSQLGLPRLLSSQARKVSILRIWLTAYCLLLTAGVGCESLQRKFTRKPKQPKSAPSPIIQFTDYSHVLTPLDRYRKHYLLFDYWDETLIRALQSASPNAKRIRRASTEALSELQTLQGLLNEEAATRLANVIDERIKLDRQFRRGLYGPSDLNTWQRQLETQRRQIGREFFWRDAQDHLKAVTSDQQQ